MLNPRPILMTKEGLKKLQNELEILQNERPAAVLELKNARELGDLSENGRYKAARAKLSSIDARLRSLSHTIRFAKVKEVNSSLHIVDIGLTVYLENRDGVFEYKIVGEFEANPIEKKISHHSPLGRALLGKKVGETVSVETPQGEKSFKIKSIIS